METLLTGEVTHRTVRQPKFDTVVKNFRIELALNQIFGTLDLRQQNEYTLRPEKFEKRIR